MAETKRQTKERLLKTFKMLTALNYRVEEAIRVNEPLDTRDWDALVALSQSRAIETQLNVLAAALENCEEELNKVWVELARDSYHDFYEFMNREEEYVMSPHQRLIGDLLMASANKETMRFMLSMPPGHTKSTHSSHHFPAWWFGKFPKLKFLQAGHSQDFVANELGAKVKSIIDSDDYRLVFPDVRLRTDMRAKDYWGLSNLKGKYVAKGAGQGISGFRGNYGMVDDPYKSRSDAESATIRDRVFKWYSDDFSTRLLPGSPLGIIMCLTGETRVAMADGSHKFLRDIRAGDEVLTWSKGVYAKRKVTKWSLQGKDESFEVRMNGSRVRGNARHPFLVVRPEGPQWVRLDELKKGDEVVSAARCDLFDRADFTADEAWALGFMFGDGWVTKNIKRNKKRNSNERCNPTASWVTCVADSPAYPERVRRCMSILEEKFGARFVFKERERYWRVEKAKLGRWLYGLGLGDGAKGKRIPLLIFQQTAVVRQAFLDGIMAADGTVRSADRQHVIGLANEGLVEDVRSLAKFLGYRTSNINYSSIERQAPNQKEPSLSNLWMFSYHGDKIPEGPFTTTKVRSIKPIGERKVYDITVETDECFIADGVVVKNTRWHSDDLCGRISDREEREQKEEEARQKEQQISQLIENLEEQKGNQKKYRFEIINLPAICEDINDPLGRAIGEALWDELFDLAALENLKADMTSASWNSLYQGTPIDAEGGAISGDWFQRYEKAPSRGDEVTANEVRRCVVSVDAANTAKERSDFTVITVWYEDFKKNHYLIDVVRKQMEFPEMSAEIARVCRRYNADALLIEAKGNGLAYLQQKKDGGAPAPLIPIEVGTASKEFRFDEVTPMIEGGQVYLPTRAIWLADFEKELISFPFGKNDDQVDSTSQYLKWARHKGRRGTKKLGGTGHRTRARA